MYYLQLYIIIYERKSAEARRKSIYPTSAATATEPSKLYYYYYYYCDASNYYNMVYILLHVHVLYYNNIMYLIEMV